MEEQRVHRRYPLHWRGAIRCSESALLYGDTLDISMGGVSFLVGQNIPNGTLVTIYLQIPPKRNGAQPLVVETRAKVLYTTFSAGNDRWRLGIQFLDFNGDPKKKLEAELARYT